MHWLNCNPSLHIFIVLFLRCFKHLHTYCLFITIADVVVFYIYSYTYTNQLYCCYKLGLCLASNTTCLLFCVFLCTQANIPVVMYLELSLLKWLDITINRQGHSLTVPENSVGCFSNTCYFKCLCYNYPLGVCGSISLLIFKIVLYCLPKKFYLFKLNFYYQVSQNQY